jgi:hypothetical protein
MQVIQFLLVQVLQVNHAVTCALVRGNQFVQFQMYGFESLFCDFWIKNTIKKVTMVVPVLITNCQVSLSNRIVVRSCPTQ